MATTDAQLRDAYEAVFDAALDEVERRARAILGAHPNLDEFVMAMGTAFFTTASRNNLCIRTDERVYMKPVNDLLDEWDEYLHLTGHPMRLTAVGERRSDW